MVACVVHVTVSRGPAVEMNVKDLASLRKGKRSSSVNSLSAVTCFIIKHCLPIHADLFCSWAGRICLPLVADLAVLRQPLHFLALAHPFVLYLFSLRMLLVVRCHLHCAI